MATAAAAAAFALSRILPFPSSQRRHQGFAISHNSWKYDYNMLVMSGSFVVLKGCYNKRHYSYSVSCLSTTVKNPKGPSILEELSIGIDGQHESQSDNNSELISQLKDLYTEIKTKLKYLEMVDVVQLLEASYEKVKEEMENGSKGVEQAATLILLALGYFDAGDRKTAHQILNMTDDIISGINEGGTMLCTVLNLMGMLFHALDKSSDAIRVYERCLKTLEKDCGNHSTFLIEPLLGLAKALEANQRSKEAIPVYKRAVDILEKDCGNHSSFLIEPLLGLAKALEANQRPKEAIPVYKRAVDILEKDCGDHSTFLIEPLLGLAKALEANQRPKEAIPVYKRAIDILEKEEGIKCVDICGPLHSLRNLSLSIGEVEDAHMYSQRVLEIHKEIYGENNGRTALAICSVAQALFAKGDVDGAISMYKQGLQVIKDANDIPLHDDNLEKLRLDLAELLHITGRLQEGREVLQESLFINQKRRGIGHPSSVAHLINLATSYCRSKNYAEAERLLRTSLNIMSKSVGPTNQATTVPMMHLAVILFHQKQFEEAESLALEALRIREDAFGPDSGPVGEALDCLVLIQAKLERDEGEILEKLKRVLPIHERLRGIESEKVMITLRKIVFYLNKAGKNDEKASYMMRLAVLRYKLNNKFRS